MYHTSTNNRRKMRHIFKGFLPLLIAGIAVTMETAVGDDKCKEMLTYNAGLIPNLPDEDIRRPKIIKALQSSGADFICLQEIWFEKDMSAILDDVQDTYPYHYSTLHASVGSLRPSSCDESAEDDSLPKETPCSMTEVVETQTKLLPCAVAAGCLEQTGQAQGVCVVMACSHILKSEAISEACISCVFLHSPLAVAKSLEKCVTPSAVHNRLNKPGLLVLSKTPFQDISFTSFHPDHKVALARGFFQAKLNDDKLAVCTHLTSIFPVYTEYNLPYGSFVNQSMAEIRTLGEKFSKQDIILLGDVNTGPKIADPSDEEKALTGEYPDNYDYLASFGYKSKYLDTDGRCTFCKANPYVVGDQNNVIDQVMLKTTSALTMPAVKRVLDACDPSLSDHFGVQAQVCQP